MQVAFLYYELIRDCLAVPFLFYTKGRVYIRGSNDNSDISLKVIVCFANDCERANVRNDFLLTQATVLLWYSHGLTRCTASAVCTSHRLAAYVILRIDSCKICICCIKKRGNRKLIINVDCIYKQDRIRFRKKADFELILKKLFSLKTWYIISHFCM